MIPVILKENCTGNPVIGETTLARIPQIGEKFRIRALDGSRGLQYLVTGITTVVAFSTAHCSVDENVVHPTEYIIYLDSYGR